MLGLPFKDSFRIEEALTHRSASHERGRKKPIPNYERLEFLGDRVVGLIVSEYLLNMWPQATEGEVGQVFSTIVSTQTLASIARRMDLGSYMILGKGSNSSGERENASLLADTFEALTAAIYCEYGLETTRQILIPWFAQPLQEILRSIESAPPREPRKTSAPEAVVPPAPAPPPRPALPQHRERPKNPPNYKLLIQKWAQQNFGLAPETVLIEESGPSHQKRFVMGLRLGGVILGEGSDRTKRGALFSALQGVWESIGQGYMPDLPRTHLSTPEIPSSDIITPETSREVSSQEIPSLHGDRPSPSEEEVSHQDISFDSSPVILTGAPLHEARSGESEEPDWTGSHTG